MLLAEHRSFTAFDVETWQRRAGIERAASDKDVDHAILSMPLTVQRSLASLDPQARHHLTGVM